MSAARREQGSKTFGRYRLVEELGAGGMASVHRAVAEGSRGFSRNIVVKRILPGQARDQRFVDLMINEARLCSLLHHPSIVQVFDFGEVDGEVFMAMEFIEGFDLHTIIRDCKRMRLALPPPLAAYLIAEVANALAYAHALRDDAGRPLHIIHRDVSPSNIMLTEHGTIKLLDFGVAKAAAFDDTQQRTRTGTGTIKGKMGYLSPEQADVAPMDHRSDIFSLGIVFWECLTLRRLFKSDSDLHTLRLIRKAEVQPPSAHIAHLDPELDAIVMKMLARDPADRFSSCDEVAAALAPFIHREGVDARSVREFIAEFSSLEGPTTSVPAARPEVGSPQSSGGALRAPTLPLERPPRDRAPWPWILAVAALAVSVGALALARPWRRADGPNRGVVRAAPEPVELRPRRDAMVVPAVVAPEPVAAVEAPVPAAASASTKTRRTAPPRTRAGHRPAAVPVESRPVIIKNPF